MNWNKKKLTPIFAAGLSLVSAGLLASCGDSKKGPEAIQHGVLYAFIEDTPFCDVLSFRCTVSGMKLRTKGTTNADYTVFPSPTVAPLIKMDFASLRDSSTVFNVSNVNVGTYDQMNLTLLQNKTVVYDPTQDPPVRTLTTTLTTSTPSAPVQPDLILTKGVVSALLVDFDMRRSIAVDAQGQITGSITPVLNARTVTATQSDGFGFFDDLTGFVTSVSAFPIGQNFTGAFTLQLLAGSGPSVSVNLTAQTDMFGVPDLASLETGRVVEVGAHIDDKGNVIARTIEAEDRAVVEEKIVAFLGYVLPNPTKDANGNVTQFRLYVREEQPEVSTEVPLDSVVVVNVSPSTYFQISSRPTNFANLAFDATAVAAGQELVVHGQYTLVTDQPTAVNANSIYLKVQTLQGGLGSLVQVGSDGKSGAFWFNPCATIQQGAPILVFTNNSTLFLNASGLGGISTQAPLLIRGLPFYQAQPGTIRGISVPAGTLVVTARQIHQLE